MHRLLYRHANFESKHFPADFQQHFNNSSEDLKARDISKTLFIREFEAEYPENKTL